MIPEYRTPTIEEFVPGFEYEWVIQTWNTGIMDLSNGEYTIIGEPLHIWRSQIFGEDVFFDLQLVEEKLVKNQIRCKT